MEGWEILLDDVLNATDEEFNACYPLFPESQHESRQRLHLMQSMFNKRNPSENLSSSGKSKTQQKAEPNDIMNLPMNANVEIPINYSNQERVFERQPDIGPVYGMWNTGNDYLATVGRHHSLPDTFQAPIALPEHLLNPAILTQTIPQTGSEVIYSGFVGTQADSREVLHEGVLHDSDNYSRVEGDDEDYLQRYISRFEASSFQEVG